MSTRYLQGTWRRALMAAGVILAAGCARQQQTNVEESSPVTVTVYRWTGETPSPLPAPDDPYRIKIIPPEPGVQHKIVVVRPDPNIDFKMNRIAPYAGGASEQARRLLNQLRPPSRLPEGSAPAPDSP